jgi:hypothetical protein
MFAAEVMPSKDSSPERLLWRRSYYIVIRIGTTIILFEITVATKRPESKHKDSFRIFSNYSRKYRHSPA